jgi:CheY-like chemotaxis protein
MSEGQHKVPLSPANEVVADRSALAIVVAHPSLRSGAVTTAVPRIYGEASGMRVLVVDDEVDLAEAVGRGLRREGYAVDVVHSGEEALDRLTYTGYDLVCLDLTMPGIDGIEVCRTIRHEYGAEPRVLMLTARDAVADRVAGLDEGADDYLVKPFALPELLACCCAATPASVMPRCGSGRCTWIPPATRRGAARAVSSSRPRSSRSCATS